MSSAHAEVCAAMNAALAAHFQNLPGSVPVAVPVAKLADAALEKLSDGRGIPKIPGYDHEMAVARKWYEPSPDLTQGMPPSLGAHRDEDADDFVVIEHGMGTDDPVPVVLPRRDAIEFALAILSAAGQ